MNDTVYVGFLGCGNIGSGTYRLLKDMKPDLASRCGLSFVVKKVLVRDKSKPRQCDVPESALVTDPAEIFLDSSISIVCEFLGGEEPAASYMLQALEHGKSVVTANKMALCLHMGELMAAAKASGAGLYFEASVCGAVPVISALTGPLLSSRISHIMGIINGTTNYILTSMASDGAGYAQVLQKAQELGLAEPNPSSDVEGTDAAYKLAIMASLAFHTTVKIGNVYTEGITGVTAADIAYGREMGYVLKLVAIGKLSHGAVEVRVHPTFLPKDHPLARVDGSYNAVFLKGHACREMMLQGVGAGDYPTASAIVADMISAATLPPEYPDFSAEARFSADWVSRYFLHLSANDQPGVLEKVAGCMASEGISIATMLQKGRSSDGTVPLIIVTHEAHEQSLQKALAKIAAISPSVCRVANVIRVEE